MTRPTRKDPSDVQFVCGRCAPRPRPELHQLPATAYVGQFVKRSFRTPAGWIEHLWVKVTDVVDGQLQGTVDNDPVFDVGYERGDRVTFPIPEVEDLVAGTAGVDV